jgi:asparagine synthase (glutamine-hydrolysing)
MCAAIEHRGPDARGMHNADGCGLGIQRLRVIDLATGDQPIYNEDRSVVVVLNGEIYNYRELRADLERRGHHFRTNGDTEAIVHLYEELGPDCVSRLDGMFAFALWDVNRRRLLVARDRLGKKPLFYSVSNGAFTFASELPALMENPDIPRDLNDRALDLYLRYGYVPAPLSVFSAVRKLPPAHYALVTETAPPRLTRYWSVDRTAPRVVTDQRELFEQIREEITRAVRRRMVADVPLGAFLSGGIDSSVVVAAMASVSSRPVETFSIGFEDVAHNELPRARAVAEAFSTRHHEFVVRPDAITMMPKIARHYGEPFADNSALPSFHLAELARRHVTVALNGDGGDESFGGYERYATNLIHQRAALIPLPVRRAIATGAQAGLPGLRNTSSRARRFAASLAASPIDRYLDQMSAFSDPERAHLYTADYREVAMSDPAMVDPVRDAWHDSRAEDPLDVMLDVDVNTYLPGDLLVKIDIATMAHSLEARSPLLDHRVVELAAGLPRELKVRRLETKVALREAARGWIPDAVVDLPKRGFRLPIARWLRTDLREYASEILLDRETCERGYFRPEAVATLLDEHSSETHDHSRKIWTLLMHEHWARTVGSMAAAPAARFTAA